MGDHAANYRAHAESLVARYPNDAEVTVYYQPGRPDDCLLEPGVPLQTWARPVIGLILLVAGSLWLRSQPK